MKTHEATKEKLSPVGDIPRTEKDRESMTPPKDRIDTTIARANTFLESTEHAESAACSQRAQAVRDRLAPVLGIAKRLIPLVEQSQTPEHVELVRVAFRVLGAPAITASPDILPVRERCGRAAATLETLWSSAKNILAGAIRDADKITGSEIDLADIEKSIQGRIRDIQNVDVTITDSLSRLRSALEDLLTEPAAAALAQPITAPPARTPARQPTHATVAASLRGGRHHG